MDIVRRSRRPGVLLTCLTTLLLAAPPVSASVSGDREAAQDYCTSVGGEVQERQAMWNTNGDPSQWVDLGRSIELCRFQADDEAQSRIYVDLLTLHTETPTLAAAAYLAQVPMASDLPAGDPASFYCADLDGSAQYGTGASGGGWVNMDDPIDIVLALCVFPDGSTIDEWGLAYHSNGTIRGTDLAPLFRADTSALPPIFAGGDAATVDPSTNASPSPSTAAGGLDLAAASEASISASRGGVVEVTNTDGTVTTIAFPAGSVSEDTTVVVTPLVAPPTEKGEPLTPGVLVEEKGAEGQHLQMASPAIVTFAIKGKVPDEAAVVTFTDPETAQPLASSISEQGETTMVTAFVPSFSKTTVDGDPEAWGDLAPLVPDHRFSLAVSGTDSRIVQKVEMVLSADGTLTSPALTGKFAFCWMSGRLDLGLTASVEAGPVVAALEGTKLKGEAKLDECWVQVADRKKGTFLLRGTGHMPIEGTMRGTGKDSGGQVTISDSFSGDFTSDARIGVKANGMPAKVGGSVPATFTIYDKGTSWQYKSELTWVRR